jgi:hypothetical protein
MRTGWTGRVPSTPISKSGQSIAYHTDPRLPGSSLMQQKKNSIHWSSSGERVGKRHLASFMRTLEVCIFSFSASLHLLNQLLNEQGLPSTVNKDLQEFWSKCWTM